MYSYFRADFPAPVAIRLWRLLRMPDRLGLGMLVYTTPAFLLMGRFYFNFGYTISGVVIWEWGVVLEYFIVLPFTNRDTCIVKGGIVGSLCVYVRSSIRSISAGGEGPWNHRYF